MHLRTTVGAAAAAVLLAAVVACTSGTSGSVDQSPEAGTNRPTATSSAEGTTEAEPEPGSSSAGSIVAFGQTYAYQDGLSVSVTPPAEFTPTAEDQMMIDGLGVPAGSRYVEFEVTLLNGTGSPFDPTLVQVSAQSTNVEATPLYLGTPPATQVLPGREVTWRETFAVPDPADVVVQVAPSFDYQPVFFTQ